MTKKDNDKLDAAISRILDFIRSNTDDAREITGANWFALLLLIELDRLK